MKARPLRGINQKGIHLLKINQSTKHTFAATEFYKTHERRLRKAMIRFEGNSVPVFIAVKGVVQPCDVNRSMMKHARILLDHGVIHVL